jgi:NAD-dependent dihydropyrimidine dehydrogenase PreA subunit
MSKKAKVIFCNCGYSNIIDSNLKIQVLNALEASAVDFEAVQDLCEMAAGKNPKLKSWAQAESINIVACYSRAVKWLFNAAGAPLDPDKTKFHNMRTCTAEEIILSLLGEKTAVDNKKECRFEERGDWIPWFPVIDYDRCKNCMQCMNFCLFGVYGLSESGLVQVINPAGCKTNCPACARMCPQTAIIFPKYTESPINGDSVDDQGAESKKPHLDMKELSRDDIYEMIRRRGKGEKRFAKDKTDRKQVAQVDLQKQLGIPSNVLESLTSEELGRLKKEFRGEKG